MGTVAIAGNERAAGAGDTAALRERKERGGDSDEVEEEEAERRSTEAGVVDG